MRNIILIIFIMLSTTTLTGCGDDFSVANRKECTQGNIMKVVLDEGEAKGMEFLNSCLPEVTEENCTEENRMMIADEGLREEFTQNCAEYYASNLPEASSKNCTEESIKALPLKTSDEKLRDAIIDKFTRQCNSYHRNTSPEVNAKNCKKETREVINARLKLIADWRVRKEQVDTFNNSCDQHYYYFYRKRNSSLEENAENCKKENIESTKKQFLQVANKHLQEQLVNQFDNACYQYHLNKMPPVNDENCTEENINKIEHEKVKQQFIAGCSPN